MLQFDEGQKEFLTHRYDRQWQILPTVVPIPKYQKLVKNL